MHNESCGGENINHLCWRQSAKWNISISGRGSVAPHLSGGPFSPLLIFTLRFVTTTTQPMMQWFTPAPARFLIFSSLVKQILAQYQKSKDPSYSLKVAFLPWGPPLAQLGIRQTRPQPSGAVTPAATSSHQQASNTETKVKFGELLKLTAKEENFSYLNTIYIWIVFFVNDITKIHRILLHLHTTLDCVSKYSNLKTF